MEEKERKGREKDGRGKERNDLPYDLGDLATAFPLSGVTAYFGQNAQKRKTVRQVTQRIFR